MPLIRPRKDECAPIFATLIDAAQGARPRGALAACLCRADPRGERLVIAGVKPKRDVSQTTAGIRSVERALQSLGAAAAERWRWGAALVWRGGGARRLAAEGRQGRVEPPASIPDWLRQPAPIEARPPRPLAPSQIAEDRDAAPPPSAEMREAARRGTLLHACSSGCPGSQPIERHALALRWLERSAGVERAGERAEIADAACSIIADPALRRSVRRRIARPKRRSPRPCPTAG